MLQRQHNRVLRGMGAGSCGHFRQGMEVAKHSPEKRALRTDFLREEKSYGGPLGQEAAFLFWSSKETSVAEG